MTRNSNAHGNGTPGAELPKFSVNVVPTDQLRREDLGTMLNLYRRGEITPLIFGDGNKPEAAIIPFAAFVRLMKYDHAAHVVHPPQLDPEPVVEATFDRELRCATKQSPSNGPASHALGSESGTVETG